MPAGREAACAPWACLSSPMAEPAVAKLVRITRGICLKMTTSWAPDSPELVSRGRTLEFVSLSGSRVDCDSAHLAQAFSSSDTREDS